MAGRDHRPRPGVALNLRCHACGHGFDVPAGSIEAQCKKCGARITLTAMETRAKKGVSAPDGLDADKLVGRELGGYRLTSVIGGGGMGIVFEAERQDDAAIDGPPIAAIKVLSPAFNRDPEFIERFNREADALLALEHPNLIRVYGKGEQDGYYFFVMERFDGEDLRALMSRGQVSPKTAVAIVAAAAAGLEQAHERGIVHRDIKPANILVRGDPAEDGVVKVVDFGVAQLAAPDYTLTSLTHSNLILGTVNYMSPEQRIDASNIDHRADVYALAVVAYELLTLRLPMGAFEPPSRFASQLSRAVDRAVLSALRREPSERPASVTAFAAALDRAIRPRVNRTVAWAGVGVVAACAAAAVVLSTQPVATKTELIEKNVVAQKVERPEPPSEGEATDEAVGPVFVPDPALVQFSEQLRQSLDVAAKNSR